MVTDYKHAIKPVIYVAASGSKKVDGSLVPFLELDGKPVISHLLERISGVENEMLLVSTNDKPTLDRLISGLGDQARDAVAIESKGQLGHNFLHMLQEYTLRSNRLPDMKGDVSDPGVWERYVNDNPICRDVVFMCTGCDMPYADPKVLERMLTFYSMVLDHYDFMPVFALKENVEGQIDMLEGIKPGFREEISSMNSSLLNFMRLSDKPIRVANVYLAKPFRAFKQTFDLIDDLYSIREFRRTENWPRIRDTISKYMKAPGLIVHIPRLTYEIAKMIGSQTKPRLDPAYARMLNFICGKGADEDNLSENCEKITGLRTRPSYFGDLSLMLDVDDHDTYHLVKKHHDILSAHLKSPP